MKMVTRRLRVIAAVFCLVIADIAVLIAFTSAPASATPTPSTTYAGVVGSEGASMYWPMSGPSPLTGAAGGATFSTVGPLVPGSVTGPVSGASGVQLSTSTSCPGGLSDATTTAADTLAAMGTDQTFTIEEWVRSVYPGVTTSNDQTILYTGNFAINFDHMGRGHMGESSTTLAVYNQGQIDAPDLFDPTQWHDVVGVVGPTQIRLYVDGKPEGSLSRNPVGAGIIPQDWNQQIRLASYECNATPGSGGSDGIAQVAIFPRVLTPPEIAEHGCIAGSGTCNPPPGTPPPTGWREWNLGGSAGALSGLDGEPVNTATGNLVESRVDVTNPDETFGIEFDRTYNSEDATSGMAGPGWSTSLDTSVTPYSSTGSGIDTYILRMPDGQRMPIDLTYGVGWGVPSALNAAFTVGASTETLTFGSGEQWVFDAAGRLSSMSDGQGQTATVSWPSSGRFPVTVTSSEYGAPGWAYQVQGSGTLATTAIGPYASSAGISSSTPTVAYQYSGGKLSAASVPYAHGGSPSAWEHYTADPATGFLGTISVDYANPGVTNAGAPSTVNEVSSSFDEFGRVASQTESSGEYLTFTYAASAPTVVTHAASSVAPTEETVQFSHAPDGTLSAEQDPYGNSINQSIVDGQLTSFQSRTGAHTTVGVASNGAVSSVDLPNAATGSPVAGSGGAISGFCSGDDRPTGGTTADGVSVSYGYATSSGCASGGTDLPTTVTAGGVATTITPQIQGSTPTDLPATITDADGDVTTEHWDIATRELQSTSETPASSPETTFYGYDAAGRPMVERTPAGIETWTTYNADGTVASVVGPVSVSRPSCTMSSTSCAFGSTPPSGPTTTFDRYRDGTQYRATSPSPTGSGTVSTTDQLDYTGSGTVETVTAPAHDTAPGSPVQTTTITTTDGLGRVVSVATGAGTDLATTTYHYDSDNNKTAGSLQRLSSTTSPTGVNTYYTYDADGQVINTQVGGTKPTWGGVAVPSVGSDGCMVLPSTYADASRSTTTTYDHRGDVTETCGPTGDVDHGSTTIRNRTSYTYDGHGRLVEETDGTISGTKLKKRWVYDATTGRLQQSIVDRNGSGGSLDATDLVTEYYYTAAGRLEASFTDPPDVSSFTWPTSSPLATGHGTGLTLNPQGTLATSYSYDHAGEVTGIKDALGHTTTQTWTVDGQLLKRTLPGGAYHQYAYDAFGNLSSDTTPSPTGSGLVARTAHYNQADVEDATTAPAPPGVSGTPTVAKAYYADGSLKSVTNPKGGTANTITYYYDVRGNRTDRVSQVALDPAHPTTYTALDQTWGYDGAGQVITSSPDGTPGHTTHQYYDDNNNPGFTNAPTHTGTGTGFPVVTQQPSGRTTTTSYWNDGLPEEQWFTNGAATSTVKTWYDERGRRTNVDDTLHGSTGESSTYGWDSQGDLTAVSVPALPSNPTPQYSYTYDLAGRPTSVTYPDTSQHTFTHDALGRLSQSNVVWPGLGSWPIVGYSYDTNNDVTKANVDFGGAITTWTYPSNHAPEPTNYTQTSSTAPTTNTTMTYGGDGRVATEVTGSTTTAYAYDAAGELTGRTVGGTADQAYSYDTHGDVTSATVAGSTTAATYNALAEIVSSSTTGAITASHTYGWDADGRRTSDANATTGSTVTTNYDERGLPSSIVTTGTGASTIDRQYDADGQLSRSYDATSGAGEDLVWDETLQIPVILDGYVNSSLWSRENYGLAQVGYQLNSSSTAVVFAKDAYGDVLPSTTNTTPPSTYDPYGPRSSTPVTGYSYRTQAALNGLVHLDHRDYDPGTESFTTPDPVDGTDGTATVANPYHYANNDPLNESDPSGLHPLNDWSMDECGAIHDVNLAEGIAALGAYKANGGSCTPTCGAGAAAKSFLGGLVGGIIHTPGQFLSQFKDPEKFLQSFTPQGQVEQDYQQFKMLQNMYGELRAGDTCQLIHQVGGLTGAGVDTAIAGDLIPGGSDGIDPVDGTDPTAPHSTVDDPGAGSTDGAGTCGVAAGGLSFAAATPVLMANGSTKEIKDVRVGDKVLAYNTTTGRNEARKVTATMVNDDTDLLDLTVTDGHGHHATIHTTANHPIWSNTAGTWVEAGHLRNGDWLHTHGSAVRVATTTPRSGSRPMLDLTIEHDHDFYVAGSVLVHNSDCYVNPGHHDPTGGDVPYNPTKSVIPADAEELFGRSIEVDGVRWTKTVEGRTTVYDRFFSDNNGNWHWSGSTAGSTLSGKPNPIPLDQVPISVKRS